ncbi:TlpA family protein disulfide reductase [Natronococcus sp. A-GB7]|uniref:TlpA family protein disulfide reductase n=1 Tax=Natronococcus sp. A-GB7 TaxID=3037649 RepID=UPI00241E3F83|nr:TlpA family protein disulfide reductase [Natronococcus sp. A-GB7]MDG5817488.1 TlpA family protein disulfide reductase [Natronococcus sp. A-GB7]
MGLNRRTLLAVAGASAVAGCLEDDTADESDSDDSGDDVDDEPESPPFELRTVDAPESEAGTTTVPGEGQVTFLNPTRTLCPTSEGLIETIGDARADLESRYDVGPEGDVRFVSMVDPRSGPDPTEEELADWWEEHGGEWTVGIDENGTINDYYEVRGFPTVLALDADGEVHWRDTGGTGASNMVRGVERALEAESEAPDPEDANESEG